MPIDFACIDCSNRIDIAMFFNFNCRFLSILSFLAVLLFVIFIVFSGFPHNAEFANIVQQKLNAYRAEDPTMGQV